VVGEIVGGPLIVASFVAHPGRDAVDQQFIYRSAASASSGSAAATAGINIQLQSIASFC